MILVAPTERLLHEHLATMEEKWQVSSLPEKHGCDLLIPTKQGIVGFQRKTLPDLVASLQDGRLYYELNQLQSSATVGTSFLLIESDSLPTTVDGRDFTEANLSVSVFRSIVAKFHYFGTGTIHTKSPGDTVACCLSVSRYLSSGTVSQIHRAKQVHNGWGQVTSESYGTFLLQSFPGIGPKVAKAIYQHFGTVPIQWSVTAADLALVPGIGRKRAEGLIAALRPAETAPGSSARPG